MPTAQPDARQPVLKAPSVGAVCSVGAGQPVQPEPDFLARLASAGRVVVVGHHNPDGDALGSAAALCRALAGPGREVRLGTSGKIAPNIMFILEAAPAGLALELRRPSDLKPSDWDLAVFVDCHGPERVWPDHPKGLGYGRLPPYLVIDHHVHPEPVTGCEGLFHDPGASSTGEMVARIIRALKADFAPETLEALLAAIASDTGFFTQANTTASALREAADLVSLGGDLEGVNCKLNQSFGLPRMRLLQLALGSIELHRGGRVACMSLTSEMVELAGAAREDSDGFVDYPRAVKGVELAALFKEDGRGRVKVSLRSRYPVSARAVAAARGGGGHVLAAAYTDPSGTCGEARERFLAGLSQALPADGD
jgi:phosphoesterase RecJ-like protein